MTTPTTVSVRLQLRADTAANWTSANPTLLANELGRETDTGKIKIGDGSTAWSSLAYQAWATLPIAVASGGTGQTSYTNGQLLIGNTTGNTLTKATLTAGSGIAITNGTGSITVAASGISDAQIAADAEITVSKLADGAARQLLQTDAAGTGVEWASNIDISGTLDVTSAATFDSTIGASAGTASLPSITFTGDLNTGIYSPGADQVAISTAGSGRLFVNSSGQVGIGATPGSVLDVRFPTSPAVNNGPGSNALRVFTTAALAANAGGAIALGGESTTAGGVYASYGQIAGRKENATSDNYAGYLQFAVNASDGTMSERLRITSAGLVGVATSSPSYLLDVAGSARIKTGATGTPFIVSTGSDSQGSIRFGSTGGSGIYGIYGGADYTGLQLWTNGSQALTIDNSQRVGVGTASPAGKCVVRVSNNTGAPTAWNSNFLLVSNGDTSTSSGIGFSVDGSDSSASISALTPGTTWLKQHYRANSHVFWYGDAGVTQAATIDTSGRLLVGTSTSITTAIQPYLQVQGTGENAYMNAGRWSNDAAGPGFLFGKSRGGSVGTRGAVANNDLLGEISFFGDNGASFNNAASIVALVDGAVSGGGANDMPGRLVFSTTADGASSPTERMRITNGGNLLVGNTTGSAANTGFIVSSDGAAFITRSGERPFYVNRLANDGNLVEFVQDNATEGTISVSGTTVSYNGAHLSRWSQLPAGAERTEILRGSVLSNIDEMCEWGEEDNEQLNRMKVSDIEGDKNVSGVFQAWDDDDDTYTNDFYCAMTGDFIIRIAEGVTVERGDLLMSAGDGTAKPQDDDIIRSKTIAKVTSTNVSCTYEDGSYCVPCVLMAC